MTHVALAHSAGHATLVLVTCTLLAAGIAYVVRLGLLGEAYRGVTERVWLWLLGVAAIEFGTLAGLAAIPDDLARIVSGLAQLAILYFCWTVAFAWLFVRAAQLQGAIRQGRSVVAESIVCAASFPLAWAAITVLGYPLLYAIDLAL